MIPDLCMFTNRLAHTDHLSNAVVFFSRKTKPFWNRGDRGLLAVFSRAMKANIYKSLFECN